MELDAQALFNALLSVVTVLWGMLVGRIFKKIDTLDYSVRKIPEKYVPKADYREDMKEIKHMLHDIRDKLDEKQDRVVGSNAK